jgi:general secretion pathway protein A
VDRAVVDRAAAEVFASDTPAPQPANSPAQRQRLGTLALGAVGGAVSAVLLLGLWGGAWPGLRVALKAADKDPATTAHTSTTVPNAAPNTATGTPNNPPAATPQTATTPTTTPTESDPNPSGPNLPSSAAIAAIATAPSPNASNPAAPAARTPNPATAEPEPSPGPPPGSALWRSEAAALRALGGVWASPLSGADPCASAQAQGLQCFRISRMTLHGLRQMDRPAVLWLRRPGHNGWALLRAMGPETATLSTAEGRWRLPLTALADIWRGDYATLWRTPPGQQGRLTAGHSGPAADWLSQQLQQLQAQGQIDANARDFAERIRAFQHSQGLDGDGLAGPITFMLVNRASGVAEPRLGRD